MEAGEPLVFTYGSKITHLAKSASGRLLNPQCDQSQYPYYFLVDLETLQLVKDIPLSKFEESLTGIGLTKNLVRSQGWPRVPDSETVERLWACLSVVL